MSCCRFWGSSGDSHRSSSSISPSVIVSTHANDILWGNEGTFHILLQALHAKENIMDFCPRFGHHGDRTQDGGDLLETCNNSAGTGISIPLNVSTVFCICRWVSSNLDNTSVDVLDRRALSTFVKLAHAPMKVMSIYESLRNSEGKLERLSTPVQSLHNLLAFNLAERPFKTLKNSCDHLNSMKLFTLGLVCSINPIKLL